MWLTFLNLGLLAGAAAAAVPLLLYLWRRRKRQVVPWGAMHLLDQVIAVRRRSLRIERLLLLLVRCAIPVVLAAAMARPVFLGAAPLLRDARRSVLILLDNSYSMQAGGSDSNFAKALQQTDELLAALPRGSDAQIVLMADDARALVTEPTFDIDRLREQVRATDAGFGRADVPRSLEVAARELGRMTGGSRELIVISDFQRTSFSDEQKSARDAALPLLRNLAPAPRLVLLPLPAPSIDNVAITSIDHTRSIVGPNQRLEIRATLRQLGSQPRENTRVFFRVDGQQRASTLVNLQPGQTAQALFEHRFAAPGSSVVEVATDPDDLNADDTMSAAIPVWDRLPVLIVTDQLATASLRGSADYLNLALQTQDINNRGLIQTKIIAAENADVRELESARVVVLVNAPRLPDAWPGALLQFVREGNGILLFPGDRIDIPWYHQRLLDADVTLLPARFDALRRRTAEDNTTTSIAMRRFEHPALELFNTPGSGDLSTATFHTWFTLTPITEPTGPQPIVLSSLQTREPMFVEKTMGEGRVILSAAACDTSWSDWPVQPSYLPLVHQLVTYLASHVFPPRNVEIGEPLIAVLPATSVGNSVTWLDPQGQRHLQPVVRRGSRAITEFRSTRRPGLYVVQLPDGKALHFVVRTQRHESELTCLDRDALRDLATELNATVADSATAVHEIDRATRHGRPIWTVMVALLLALLFLELYLQQRFASATG